MKRLIVCLGALFFLLGITVAGFPDDSKITALTEDTSPTTDDLIVTVNDPGGTAADRKVTLNNLEGLFVGGSDTQMQYNNGGAFGGDSNFLFDDSNLIHSITQNGSNVALQIGDGTYSWGHTPQVGIEGTLEIDGTLYADGGIQSGASATPGIVFDDSDSASETIDARIYANATDTGAGTEDVDLFFEMQVNSTPTTLLQLDADGYAEFAQDVNVASGNVFRINGTDLKDVTETLTNKTLTSPVITTPSVTLNRAGTFSSPITTNPYTMTATLAKGGILYYGATGEIDLPAGEDGMNLIIYNTGAFTLTIDPNGTETIVRDGTLQSGGVSMTLDSGAGHYVCMVYDGATWITLGYSGTLAEGS